MAVKFTNNAKTTLASSLTNVATSASVVDGSVFPTLGAGEYFYCTFDDGSNNEIVKVTARSGNTLTIVRGVDNTSARAFSSGDSAELRATAGLLTDIQENIAAKSANQTVYNTTTASSATDYDIGIDPSVEANAMVFLNGVMQHHDTFSFSGSTLTFDAAPPNGMALEVIVDNLINLQSSNLTVDTFTAADVGGNPQTDFTLSDAPAAEDNLLVFIDGVFQDQDAYTISNQTLTITDGVTADFGVTVYVINPVNIGTPSDGTVTSAKLSGNITMPADLTVTGDVAFDSPTFVVDNANSRVGLGTATPSVPVDIVGEVKISSHLNMPDNAIAKFGTGSDLQIYHDGSHSYIKDAGTGNLKIQGAAYVILESNEGEQMIRAQKNDSVRINFDGATKLETTSTGIDVTGEIVGDGLDITDSASDIAFLRSSNATTSNVYITNTNATTGNTANLYLAPANNVAGSQISSIAIEDFSVSANRTADLAFSTRLNGTMSERLRIDSSGNVGIGTSSPSTPLDVVGSGKFQPAVGGGDALVTIAQTNSNAYVHAGLKINAGNTNPFYIYQSGSSNTLRFNYNSLSDAGGQMVITDGGNVGIGTTSPSTKLDVAGNVSLANYSGTGENKTILAQNDYGQMAAGIRSGIPYVGSISPLDFALYTGNSEKVRIDSSGNVGIGTSSPSVKTHIYDASTDAVLYIDSGNANGSHARFLASGSVKHFVGSGGGFSLGDVDDFGIRSFDNILFATGNSSTEKMRIDSSGGLLIGKTSGGSTNTGCEFGGSGTGGLAFNLTSTNECFTYNNNNSSGATYLIDFRQNNASKGQIQVSSTSTTYATSSDYRLKENIQPLENGLQRLNELNPVQFDWKEDGTSSEGFIAHEVQEIFPDAVSHEKDGEQMQSMDYGRITPLLVKAIQEQQAQIETLKQEIQELKE